MLIRLIDSMKFRESFRDIHKKLGLTEEQTMLCVTPDGALNLLRKSPNASLGVDNQPLAGYSYSTDSWTIRPAVQ